jgi:hypothetical protein
MDDDGSVSVLEQSRYKSFTDLECALKKFQQDNHYTPHEPMLFRTRGEHANHYITDAVIMYN